jgi:ribonuclease P protein component
MVRDWLLTEERSIVYNRSVILRGRDGCTHEAHLPAESSPPAKDPWLPQAEVHPERGGGPATPAGQGPAGALGLRATDRRGRSRWGASFFFGRGDDGMTKVARSKLTGVERLRRRDHFQEVYRAARSAADRRLVVYARPNGLTVSRIGFAVGRKVGGAVARNRVRRQLREAVHRQAATLPGGWDWIVVARGAARGACFTELQTSLTGLLERAAGRWPAGAEGGQGRRGESEGNDARREESK